MKRLAVWVLYVVGTIAIGYLALYAYVAFTGRDFQPGDPIHIFRKPYAPSYSVLSTSLRVRHRPGGRPWWMKLYAGGDMVVWPSAKRSISPWCVRARLRVGLGVP